MCRVSISILSPVPTLFFYLLYLSYGRRVGYWISSSGFLLGEWNGGVPTRRVSDAHPLFVLLFPMLTLLHVRECKVPRMGLLESFTQRVKQNTILISYFRLALTFRSSASCLPPITVGRIVNWCLRSYSGQRVLNPLIMGVYKYPYV